MGGIYPAKRKASVILAYFLIYVVWGSTYYFIGVALRDMPTFLLGALRFSLAGILLLAICACRGERVWRRELLRRSAVSGIVLLFVDMAVIMLAQRFVSSSLVAIVASSTGIWIMLLDVPMWRKNFRNFRMVAGMLIFYGIGLGSETSLFLTEIVVVAVYVIQQTFSSRWLLFFRFGPLEWGWGMLTYEHWIGCRK